VHPSLLSAWCCWCFAPLFCCLQCLCGGVSCSYGNMCTFPCLCRVFWCLVPHFCVRQCLCGGVVMEICAPFPACAGCSGASSHTSACGSVCVGGFCSIEPVHLFLLSAWFRWCFVPHFSLSAGVVRCAPFPASAGCSGASFRISAAGSFVWFS